MILSSGAKTVLGELHKNGFEAYIVGGCVRDSLMGITPHDFDVTTNALPEEISHCFSEYRTVNTGIRHGTVIVVVDGENIEVTTFRIDGEYTDNRRPSSVSFTDSLVDDLSRRDFTVNAMAYCEQTGIVDCFGGKEDIEKKLIRCVGDPVKRFGEDALRIMRAIRFSSVLGFDIEEKTSDAVTSLKDLLKNISVERIFSELKLLLMGKNAEEVLRKYLSVLKAPISCVCEKCHDSFKNAPYDIFVRLSLFLYGDPDDAVNQLRALHSDNRIIKNVGELLSFRNSEILGEVFIRRLILGIGEEQTKRLLYIRYARSEIDNNDLDFLLSLTERAASEGCFSLKNLKINGKDLLSLGISGEKTGIILNTLLRKVAEKELPNDREALKEYILSTI